MIYDILLTLSRVCTKVTNKSIDDIPLKWFKAAESEIRGKKEILNQKTVNKLAADAYRQFCLKGDEISTLLVPNG